MKPARSLKTSLTLPYAALIVLMALAMGSAAYWAGNRSLTAFSERLMLETVARIGQAVHGHIQGSGAVLEAAFPDGMAVGPDIGQELDAIRMRFWIATSMYTNPNDYVYYGNQQGQGIGLKRLGPQEGELRVKLQPGEHRTYSRFRGIDGEPAFVSREAGLFDPRTRLWYQLASKTDRHTWTAVYIDFSARDLVVTRARRVLSGQGEFEGVVATDVSLRALNRFMSGLNVGEQGRAFIVERDGQLIAASHIDNVASLADGSVARINVMDSNDSVIQAAYEGLVSTFYTHDQPIQQILVKDRRGESVSVAARRIVDDAGLEWLAVVAVPRAEVLQGVNTQLGLTLLISLLAVGVAMGVGLRLYGRVAGDIASLSSAVSEVRRGALDVPLHIDRQDEIGELARNVQAMHRDLFSDRLTGAGNRTALMNVLDKAVRLPASEVFTVFFIDLNRFKPLNDTYGHDNGDRALIEVVQRLQIGLRPKDFLARLGGDEFVLVLRGVDEPLEIQRIEISTISLIEQPIETLKDVPTDVVVRIGAALGAATWPRDAADPESLLKLADQRMYEKKRKLRDIGR